MRVRKWPALYSWLKCISHIVVAVVDLIGKNANAFFNAFMFCQSFNLLRQKIARPYVSRLVLLLLTRILKFFWKIAKMKKLKKVNQFVNVNFKIFPITTRVKFLLEVEFQNFFWKNCKNEKLKKCHEKFYLIPDTHELSFEFCLLVQNFIELLRIYNL